MRIPKDIQVFGDPTFRGECKSEELEQQDFVAWLRLEYPIYARVMLHPKNEGRRNPQQAARDKRNGCLNTGASDIIIPAKVSFICELKRADHTRSNWQAGQIDFLEVSQSLGSFACVALGCAGAKEAFMSWLEIMKNNP